jgi:hypothetical protein
MAQYRLRVTVGLGAGPVKGRWSRMERIADALGVSTSVAVLVLVVVSIQLALQIFALIDLARRPAVAGGKKWVWLVVILLGNLVGSVLYLAVGRRADVPVDEQYDVARAPQGDSRTADAVDLLYGRKDGR